MIPYQIYKKLSKNRTSQIGILKLAIEEKTNDLDHGTLLDLVEEERELVALLNEPASRADTSEPIYIAKTFFIGNHLLPTYELTDGRIKKACYVWGQIGFLTDEELAVYNKKMAVPKKRWWELW